MRHAIVPTAQRLAEENNVDWRVLTGSGEGGSVVERDVLGYLARVMRGEEATDPTPEPLPEGLSAWPKSRSAAAERPTSIKARLRRRGQKLEPKIPLLRAQRVKSRIFLPLLACRAR